MKTVLLIVVLGALLGLSLWGASSLWAGLGVEISMFGWAVLGGGALLTIALGAGLMALSFHSAKAGYDDRAQNQDLMSDRGGGDQTLDRRRDGGE